MTDSAMTDIDTASLEQRVADLEALLAPLIAPRAAVPPITIGELTNVPTPGAAINSPWTQDVTNRVVHRFATTAARDGWTGRGPGSLAYVTGTKQLFQWDGTGWAILYEPQQTWNPVWSAGITAGNGTWLATAQRENGWCNIWARFTYGSTTGSTGPPRLTLPYPAQVLAIDQFAVGMFHAADGGFALGTTSDVADMTIYSVKTDLAVAGVTNISGSSPWVWGAGDRIFITGRYLLTTPYALAAERFDPMTWPAE
jgi:hypothetical protein